MSAVTVFLVQKAVQNSTDEGADICFTGSSLDDLTHLHLGAATFRLTSDPLSVPPQELDPDGDAFVLKPDARLELPASDLQADNLGATLAMSWDKLRATSQGGAVTLAFDRLRLGSSQLPLAPVEGDLRLSFDPPENGRTPWNASASPFHRHGPAETIQLAGATLTESALALTWQEPSTNYWFHRLAGDMLHELVQDAHEMTLQALYDADGLDEFRLSWSVSQESEFRLLGVAVAAPAPEPGDSNAEATFSLVLTQDGGPRLNRLLLLSRSAQPVHAGSALAWNRDNGRELQNDLNDDGTGDPGIQGELVQFRAEPVGWEDDPTMVLLDVRLDPLAEARFFRQLRPGFSLNGDALDPEADIKPLTIHLPDAEPAWEVGFGFLEAPWIDFDEEGQGSATSALLPEDAPNVKLPFLNQEGKQSGNGQQPATAKPKFDQNLTLTAPDLTAPLLADVPGKQVLRFPATATLNISTLSFASDIPFDFSWEDFAMHVSHPTGLDLLLDPDSIDKSKLKFEEKEGRFTPTAEHLGLVWDFYPVKLEEGPNADKYHLFTLSTEHSNYQIQMAEGARIEISYTRASKEPIVFAVTRFALSSAGITLAAEVLDLPVRLNGVNTEFTFSGSSFEIVENQIKSFTLAGSGKLPPDLVGDAEVDVALQFEQREDSLTLVAGEAELKGDKLLSCDATRFQFQIDAIGLKIVNEDTFHIYFTLTGKANFVLRKGDSKSGALALLPDISIELDECPLVGDVSVLAKHVKFLVVLAKPIPFKFLGAYEFELRAIGFIPAFEPFDDAAAMQLAGQIKFASGAGDTPNPKPDVHSLYIGLPEEGKFFPRLHLSALPVAIQFGEAFKLSGTVDFVETQTAEGFDGEGIVEIKGLPPIAAAFGFVRVRQDERSPWKRAWFIYLEARHVSFQVPLIQNYIREIGIGFGYRYTLVSIKEGDEPRPLAETIAALRELSRTQGNLAEKGNWALDIEDRGDPRWTIVFRAMFSQTSAAPSPLKWNEKGEESLPSQYLLDAIVAVRSDLTFFMAVRGWISTNYWDYDNDPDIRNAPIVSGFVVLWPRVPRFLAHVASNPGGHIGLKPPLPPQMYLALKYGTYSATLLIEPGLLHFELGWPNMLGFKMDIGPLHASFVGGFILRVTRTEMVIGISFQAKARLEIKAEFDLGVVGASLYALARVNFGGRLIGVGEFQTGRTYIYGMLGLEMQLTFRISVWIRLLFFKAKASFSLHIGFSARVRAGLLSAGSSTSVGIIATGTVSIRAFGRGIQFNVRLAHNDHVVNAAFARTDPYMRMGLEAADTDMLPEAGPPARALSRAASSAVRSAVVGRQLEFSTPDYNVFVIAPADAEDYGYFVLLPSAEGERGTGFLPAPPAAITLSLSQSDLQALDGGGDVPQAVRDGLAEHQVSLSDQATVTVVETGRSWDIADGPHILSLQEPQAGADGRVTVAVQGYDYRMVVPSGDAFALEQFDPASDPGDSGSWWRPRPETWRAHWKADVAETQDGVWYQLKDYLSFAFKQDQDDQAIGDPDPLPPEETLSDERVHNPTDSAFEAAVRGAVEQFRGSPFFKRDPSYEYDRVMDEAFADDTSIYADSGKASADEAERASTTQGIHQLRGVIFQDMITDLRDFCAAGGQEAQGQVADHSIAFRCGLVFRFRGNNHALPAWLRQNVKPEHAPTIAQRRGPDGLVPDGSQAGAVRTFNVQEASFLSNPPQFQRVRPYSSAHTIAIAWDLTWENPPQDADGDPVTGAQAEPEHHLLQYEVRRRTLNGRERDVVYTLKNADVLCRQENENGSVLKALKPRFQVADHFGEEPLRQPISYLYTITPKDFAGNAGRPLSLVVTRHPDEPPAVPVDAQLTVTYKMAEGDLGAPLLLRPQAEPRALGLLQPTSIDVEWTEPQAPGDREPVPVKDYWLVFRREATLPIGSYGLDSSTQGPGAKALPTSNARALPTDVKVRISGPIARDGRRSRVQVTGDVLQAGVFPTDGEIPDLGGWQPASWRLFIQTESAQGVPSALAPVHYLLHIESESATAGWSGQPVLEERRPAALEWLPQRTLMPMLPPEDGRTITGPLYVPMPRLADGEGQPLADRLPTFTGPAVTLWTKVQFQPHPSALRVVRLRWNQGPSQAGHYPLALTAGYHLLELDIDAHNSDTLASKEATARALKTLQEVRMLPGDELVLEPGDTLTTARWEAWYPSAVQRRELRRCNPVPGSESTLSQWYGWRDSILVWPEWPASWLVPESDRPERQDALHPDLQRIVTLLEREHQVDLQLGPPQAPGSTEQFLQATAPSADPYGWSILQRFGLSVTLTLRDPNTKELRTGNDLLEPLSRAVAGLSGLEHLHVELLFQPARSTGLSVDEALDESALLGLVQLSLRPTICQLWDYGQVTITGPGNAVVEITVTPAPDRPCALLYETAFGMNQLDLDEETQLTLALPMHGQLTLLLRAQALPEAITAKATGAEQPIDYPVTKVPATDDRVAAFAMPDDLAADFCDPTTQAGGQWQALRRYVESLSSNDPDIPKEGKIVVPHTAETLESGLPNYLVWLQRFFDHSGAMTDAGQSASGPWLVTAYPTSGSPAFVTPDGNNRLQYDHILADRWAHNYRYYIRPYGRYDQLWHSLGLAFAGAEPPDLSVTMLEPERGGLDVVLDRTQPVAMPVVLRSSRLDAAGTPALPPAPGKTWEVIVARHAEQALIERNQTLVRQLSYRQIAFTLLRRFAYPELVDQLPGVSQETIDVVAEVTPEIPSTYEVDPSPLSPEEEQLALDLPRRIRRFQQGAIVLQWDALPFYYEHRLLLVAQTSGTVSPANQVVQQDFEYVTPTPQGTLSGAASDWKRVPPFVDAEAPALSVSDMHGRQVTIALRPLWESLSGAARQQWPSEDPAKAAPGKRTYSSLPDPDVVYQIVLVSGPNLEVQAEIYTDPAGEPPDPANPYLYKARQIGRQFLAEVTGLIEPPTVGGDAVDDYRVTVALQQISQVRLEGSYPDRIWDNVALLKNTLNVAGVLTGDDLETVSEYLAANAADPRDLRALDQLYEGWYSQVAVSHRADLPPGLTLDYLEPSECTLVWEGSMDEAALRALPGDAAFKAGIEKLIAASTAGQETPFVRVPLGPDQVPWQLEGKVSLSTETQGGINRYTQIHWSGSLLREADEQALQRWAQFPTFMAAVRQLLDNIHNQPIATPAVPMHPPRPLQSELPAELQSHLSLGDENTEFLRWSGSHVAARLLRPQIAGLQGDPDFETAVADLLRQLDKRPFPRTQTISNSSTYPSAEALAARSLEQLSFVTTVVDNKPVAIRLEWVGDFPTGEQLGALDALAADATYDQPFRDALAAWLDLLRRPFPLQTPMPYVYRPRAADLDPSLSALNLHPTSVHWEGVLPNEAQWDKLQELTTQGDRAFRDGIAATMEAILAQVISADYVDEVRPSVPAQAIAERLLIGREVLRHHGLMTAQEARDLQANTFTAAPDRRAVQRLYAASLDGGMRNRELQIKARRGTAAPSGREPLAVLPLEVS